MPWLHTPCAKSQVLSADPDALYAVAVLDGPGELAVIAVADYHCPARTVADAAAPGASLQVGLGCCVADYLTHDSRMDASSA